MQRHGFYPWVGKAPLEKEMATHSSIPCREILWTEELAGYSPWGPKSWTRLSN